MPVYMIRAGETEMVKLGWADEDVEARRRGLQCAHYEHLTVIRVIDGERWIEHSMHRRFAEQWVRGEWFRFHPEMLCVAVADLEPPALAAEPIPLAADVESFLAESGMTPTAFGIQALNDPMLVHDMRKGRECKRVARGRIADFIAERRQVAA